MRQSPLQDFDFSLIDDANFKEDSVREVIISPLLYALGYVNSPPNKIERSRALTHPFVNIGSKKQKIYIIPDYLLTVRGKTVCVLDAKAPTEEIKTGKNVEQAYSYAIHPDIRAEYYALCNGKAFILFRLRRKKPVQFFHLSEIAHHWQALQNHLAPENFVPSSAERLVGKTRQSFSAFDYNALKPLPEIKKLRKQSARRHFGVHPYFTKQVWNVVQEYIKNFTQPGDVVLDPFGGSGVTLVEALILGRRAIHIDLNPLSVFLVRNLVSPIDLNKLGDVFGDIVAEFERNAPWTTAEIEGALRKYPYPQGTALPRNADVETIEQLFTRKQNAQLAYLKHLIKQENDVAVQGSLLLMFSGLLNKINLTYHASGTRSEGRGDSAVFRYYRYRIARVPVDLDIVKYFRSRYKKVVAAKKEIAPLITEEVLQNAQIERGTATNLAIVSSESVDYIYTDPPYGKKIQYLDLSIMWLEWLDLSISADDYKLEAIEGGELRKSKANYAKLLAESIKEMYRVLKFDRWMSFVFAHKDPAYWHLIVETAEQSGFEYMGAVKQSNNKTTFKKRQNPFTVLEGQLIINFKKVHNPKAIMKVDLGADIADIIIETIEAVIARNEGATLEEINNELILRGLELGFLDILSRKYQDISPLLSAYFILDDKTQKFHLPKSSKFKSQIDVRLRIRYFLLSYMRRMARQNYHPTFDEIILNIMPLLKNGRTPEKQTILSVLEEVAIRIGDGRWMLKDLTGLQLGFMQQFN